MLEQFHRHLRHRDIFATNSSKWGDPRAKLLSGTAWTTPKPLVLASLELPEDPHRHLGERAALLHDTYTDLAHRLARGSTGSVGVRFDEAGRLHLAALAAEPDPPSLVELRRLTSAMLPRVDLPEVLLEVFSWTRPRWRR